MVFAPVDAPHVRDDSLTNARFESNHPILPASISSFRDTMAAMVGPNTGRLHDVSFTQSQPESAAEMRVDFVNRTEVLRAAYSTATDRNAPRMVGFQQKLEGVFDFDREAFNKITDVGKDLKTLDGKEVGTRLAKIMQETIDNHQNDEDADKSNIALTNFTSTLASIMVAKQGTFPAGSRAADTIAMVDAFETQLRTRNGPEQDTHAMIWGDTHEPGIAEYDPRATVDRHNYSDP